MLEYLAFHPIFKDNQRHFEPGERLIVPMTSPGVLIVLAGTIDVLLLAPDSEATPFCWQTLVAGDWVVPTQDVSAEIFSEYQIRAVESSTVMLSEISQFRTLLATDRCLAAELFEIQSRRVSALRRDMARLRMQTAENRFMHYLLTENHFDGNGQTILDGFYNKIALRLNVAPATLCRVLADLQKQGRFSRKGRQLSLRSPSSPKKTSKTRRMPVFKALV